MSYDAVKALLSQGVSRPTLYQVIIDFGLFGLAGFGSNRQLEFLCKRAAVPPVTLNTLVVAGHESMGVSREQPTLVGFGSPFSITVISDRNYTVYKDLKRWFNGIAVNANPSDGVFGGFGGQSQRMKYYNSFAREITLIKQELEGGDGSREPNGLIEPFRVTFNKAFPVRLGEITLASDAYDSAVEFTVDFAFETYTFKDPLGRIIDFAETAVGVAGGTFPQVISDIAI